MQFINKISMQRSRITNLPLTRCYWGWNCEAYFLKLNGRSGIKHNNSWRNCLPSFLSGFNISVTCNTVPATWMAANISALYKKDDETDKLNYRPISLPSVLGKLMKSKVASTIVTHVAWQGLKNPRQWPYEKCHFTELLLATITDDWRRVLGKNYVEG